MNRRMFFGMIGGLLGFFGIRRKMSAEECVQRIKARREEMKSEMQKMVEATLKDLGKLKYQDLSHDMMRVGKRGKPDAG